MLSKATKRFEILFVIHTISSHLLPSSALQLPLLDPKKSTSEILPSPLTATEQHSAPNSSDNCFCRGGGQLTWPIGINAQVINLSTMIYCQPNSSFDYDGLRPEESTMAEEELARCRFFGTGWVGFGIEAPGGTAYVLYQDWTCKGLAEVKRNGTLCGVYLGVDDEGP